jgi:hypothetical protein
MKQFIIPVISSMIVWSAVFAYTYKSDPSVLLEKQNRKTVTECIDNLDDFTWSTLDLQEKLMDCANIELKFIEWTSTPDIEGEA